MNIDLQSMPNKLRDCHYYESFQTCPCCLSCPCHSTTEISCTPGSKESKDRRPSLNILLYYFIISDQQKLWMTLSPIFRTLAWARSKLSLLLYISSIANAGSEWASIYLFGCLLVLSHNMPQLFIVFLNPMVINVENRWVGSN